MAGSGPYGNDPLCRDFVQNLAGQQSLTINEELGDQPGMAMTYHQLGIVAQQGGDLDQARDWYQQSLTINEELGNRPGMAITYGQLGLLAEDRERLPEAMAWAVKCVALFAEFPHPATGPAPRHLVRLTKQLGPQALAEAWRAVTGNELPPAVRECMESRLQEES